MQFWEQEQGAGLPDELPEVVMVDTRAGHDGARGAPWLQGQIGMEKRCEY